MSKPKNKQEKQQEIIFDLATMTLDIPDDGDMWTDKHPFVQWNNREKSWEFPLKYWAGSTIEMEYELVEVDHGAEVEHGFLLDTIHISVIAWRYTWERPGEGGRMIYSASPDFEASNEWSKRYNFLCLIRETGDDEPTIITAKGYTGEFLYNALNQGRKRTLKLARKLTGRQFPGYLFWIPLTAGEKRMVGKEQKSPIYPPAPIAYEVNELDTEGLSDLLQSLYVGDNIKALFASYLYTDGQTWATEITGRLEALPSGKEKPIAEILPGGILWLPDLSKSKRGDWIDCAMTIPDLFQHHSHASNAFAKVLRSQGLGGASQDRQWEAWRVDLERRWNEKLETDEAVAVEMQLRNGS